VNPRTRRLALYAIGAIAILASANALAHSYAGLYDWAVHHRLTGWQAKSWPARQRVWPWATALIGLAVGVAGNIGHIQPGPGQPVILADRLTAATSPLAAFAGLSVGLLVLKMTRQQANARVTVVRTPPALVLSPHRPAPGPAAYRPANADSAPRPHAMPYLGWQ
jgi:hypothetical protein